MAISDESAGERADSRNHLITSKLVGPLYEGVEVIQYGVCNQTPAEHGSCPVSVPADQTQLIFIPAHAAMELKSSAAHSPSNDLHGDWGYGGTIPEHITSEQWYKSSGRKKSNVRLNDQLIPKPTDVNVVERMTKIPAVKEHPFSSHISRFAMFPSFCSPDDPERGVRAAGQPFPNHRVPSRAPDVTLLSKAIGGPYRHEILGAPGNTRKKAVTRTRENGFSDQEETLKDESPGFYPAPTKTVFPKPKLRHWDVTLSERTSNMLKNLERTLWVTSYQTHYTGSGPANPLKIDDFREKISNFSRINSHSAPLREMSYPVFVPSKPKQGRRRWSKVHFDEALMQQSESQSSRDVAAAQISNTERRTNMESREQSRPTAVHEDHTSSGSHEHLFLGSIIEEEGKPEGRELLQSNSSILPRPPILPGIHQSGTAPSLLELQHSFSKSEARKKFNSSISQAPVNLRDHGVTGKKHSFFGINCNYIHG